MPSQPALELIDLTIKATVAYDRPDLTARLRSTRERLADPSLRVLVVGEFKQGKSALVNSLLGADVCPVDDDISTSVTTAVRFTPGEPAVTLVRRTGEGDEQRQERRDVPPSELRNYVSEAGNPGNREGVSHVEVRVGRPLLKSGLVLVDTPGVGGLGSAHGAMTMAALPSADAVLLVSDAGAEYTAPEVAFLRQAKALCSTLACVLTKIDMYPEWRRIADLDVGHLRRAGVEADLIPVSSLLRAHAFREKDADLNRDSRFESLLSYLEERVVKQRDALDRRTAAENVSSAVEQMVQKMRIELEAQQDPDAVRGLVAELTSAKQRAEDLKKRSARWQVTLNDGCTDLQADIDHDLRDRIRTFTKEAEELLDHEDPADVWDQFADWVQASVAHVASTNFVWATERAQHLAGQAADHFVTGGQVAMPAMARAGGSGYSGRANPMIRPEMAAFRVGAALLTGMKGGQGGIAMFGMITSLAGMAMVNPITGVAALALGAKGVRDERKRLLDKRRAECKQALRKYLDEVSFQAGKESKDMLRGVQRTLRDHFTDTAQEIATSMSEAVASAQAAVTTASGERKNRISSLEREIERLGAVEKKARALVPA